MTIGNEIRGAQFDGLENIAMAQALDDIILGHDRRLNESWIEQRTASDCDGEPTKPWHRWIIENG